MKDIQIWGLKVAGGSSTPIPIELDTDNQVKSTLTADLDIRDLVNATDSISAYQVSGANWSVNITNSSVPISSGESLLVNQLSGSNWSVTATATDLDIRDLANATDSVSAYQVSGHRWSTEATQGTSPWVVSATDLDIRDLVNATDSISAYQVSGHRWSTEATQSGTWNVTVNGATATVAVVGDKASDVADDEANPIKIGGVARTANPTAVANGDRVSQTYDDLGRPINTPIQVRDLIATAYATVSNITETTLLAGAASTFHDLIFVKFSNQSGAAVNVSLRSSTGGTIIDTFSIPANSTVGYAPPRPVPQSGEAGSAWTFQNTASDDSNTTIAASGLFSKEV